MALPGDVTTFDLQFGAYTDAVGLAALVAAGGKLFAVDPSTNRKIRLTHITSGQVIVPDPVDVTISEDGTGVVTGIPHTGQATLSPVGYAWRVEWNIASNKPSPGNLTFVVDSGATADFDLLVPAETVPAVAISQPTVASVNGQTGAVSLDAGDVGAATPGDLTAGLATKVAQDKLVTYAADHGIVGDGVADDSAALNDAAAFAATYGLRLLLAADSTIRLATAAFEPPSGSRIDGNGATIVSALPGDGTASSTGIAVNIEGKTGVAIWDLRVDGDKASYTPATEWRHNIRIVNSTKVLLRDVVSFNAKGDGVYVGNEILGPSRDVQLDNVTCDGNHRNGMSIIACIDLYAFGCRFINSIGTLPETGLDIEPNTVTDQVRELKFVACTFAGNHFDGMGINTRDAATVVQGGFEFIGCTFADNGNDGVSLRGATDLRIIGGTISGNVGHGVSNTASSVGTIARHLKLAQVEIRNNGKAGFDSVASLEQVSIVGCTIRDNSQTTPLAFDGINLPQSAPYSSTGGQIIGNTISGATQRYGLRTVPAVAGLFLSGNQYVGNGTAARSLSGTGRTDLDFVTSPWAITFPMRITADSGLVTYEARVTGDTQDRWVLRSDGKHQWGPGNATFDTDLSRVAANVLGMGANDAFMTGKSVTGSRPTAASVGQGSQFFDTTLNKPIWSDGTAWRDAAGTVVTQGLYTRSSLGSFRPLTVDPSVAGRVWGVSSAGLSFMGSNGTAARTDVGAMPTAQSAVQLTFTAAHVFLLTSGSGSRLGQLWRSPLPAADGTGLTWTKMFDLTGGTTTVGGGVDGGENSYFRNACFATDGTRGYLLEYGAVVTGGPSLYYTGNIAATSYTWALRKTWTNGKHGHAVKVISGVPWVMIGDGGYTDLGLWCATDFAAGTWNRRSLYGEATGGNALYGVSFLPVAIDGHPLIVAESDTHHPHAVLAFNSQSITKSGVLQPVNTIPAPYNGTVRSLTLTSEGNLMWVQTGENGAVGPYDSIWIAKAPFTTPVMLESIPATNALGTLGDPVESGDYVFFGTNRIRKEKFVGQ